MSKLIHKPIQTLQLLSYHPDHRVYAVSVSIENPNASSLVYLPDFLFSSVSLKSMKEEEESGSYEHYYFNEHTHVYQPQVND